MLNTVHVSTLFKGKMEQSRGPIPRIRVALQQGNGQAPTDTLTIQYMPPAYDALAKLEGGYEKIDPIRYKLDIPHQDLRATLATFVADIGNLFHTVE